MNQNLSDKNKYIMKEISNLDDNKGKTMFISLFVGCLIVQELGPVS